MGCEAGNEQVLQGGVREFGWHTKRSPSVAPTRMPSLGLTINKLQISCLWNFNTISEGAVMTVIAMTREIGCHGFEVAAGVAAALGLEIVNSEIVVPHVAGSLGVEQSAVQRYLEGKASLFDRWQIDTRKLSQYTLDQILNLALKDSVLIRGWGAAALFQGIRGVICVRVCAPMALRVRVMVERLAVKDAEAIQQEIERFDAGHSRAMRAAFSFDWNDALLYHMVLNTARMSVDACVEAVCGLAKHPDFQDDPASALRADQPRYGTQWHLGSGGRWQSDPCRYVQQRSRACQS
jgi:cytidylate kinase